MLKCINYQPPHNEVGSPQTAQFVCFLWLLSFAQAKESDWLSGHPRLSFDLDCELDLKLKTATHKINPHPPTT